MYVVAVLAAFIASLSPLGGLIFTLAYGEKYRENLVKYLAVFLLAGILLFVLKIVDIVSFTDIVLGVGVSVWIYFWVFKKTGKFLPAILITYGFSVILAVCKKLIFHAVIMDNIEQAMSIYERMINTSFQNNPEQLDMGLQLLNMTKQIFTNYYIAIWALSMIIGLYLGSLLVSKKSILKWQHKLVRLPYETVYFLILALVIFLIPNWRILGINALLIAAPLFLIQGISILDFYWGNFFKKAKFLLFLLIVSMVFNYFILSLIALIGLLDIWFDFRKIRIMEDIDESHSG